MAFISTYKKNKTRITTTRVPVNFIEIWTKIRYRIFTSLLMFTCIAMFEISCPFVNMLQVFATCKSYFLCFVQLYICGCCNCVCCIRVYVDFFFNFYSFLFADLLFTCKLYCITEAPFTLVITLLFLPQLFTNTVQFGKRKHLKFSIIWYFPSDRCTIRKLF